MYSAQPVPLVVGASRPCFVMVPCAEYNRPRPLLVRHPLRPLLAHPGRAIGRQPLLCPLPAKLLRRRQSRECRPTRSGLRSRSTIVGRRRETQVGTEGGVEQQACAKRKQTHTLSLMARPELPKGLSGVAVRWPTNKMCTAQGAAHHTHHNERCRWRGRRRAAWSQTPSAGDGFGLGTLDPCT